MRTDDLNRVFVQDWISNLSPDIIVIHTGSWVGKKIRLIPNDKIVIGGHPGLAPFYRGAHSAFWAIYNNRPEDVACTIFHLDSGVDTGDIIAQEKISIDSGDSYFSLGWKGVKMQAEMMVNTILRYEEGINIPRIKSKSIPDNSYFDIPTFGEYLKYKSKQKLVR